MKTCTIIQTLLATTVAIASAESNAVDSVVEKAVRIRGGQTTGPNAATRQMQTCTDRNRDQCEKSELMSAEDCETLSQASCKSTCDNTSGCKGWSFSWNSDGGGACQLRVNNKSISLCNDDCDWKDSKGYGCSAYEQWGDCETEGYKWENFGMTAQDACCACDGGIQGSFGRPFVDSDDRTLVSTLHVNAASSSWGFNHDISASCSDASTDELNTHNDTIPIQTSDTPNDIVSSDVVTAWSKRGLGEHASVASFAAFTLALMTNNAPPTLIRDSLNAALDEVNHATSSFEVASLFAGKVVEPSPLPPSAHQFAQDMSALALGAAREGCVEETLSVLAALAEANSYEAIDDGSMSFSDVSMLKARLNVIAEDEGRHSSLAWRTVRWACSVDSDACDEVKREVFEPSNLDRRAQGLLESEELRELWKGMYQVLIPFVTGEAVPELETICGEQDSDEVASKSSAKALVDDVVRSVVCEL